MKTKSLNRGLWVGASYLVASIICALILLIRNSYFSGVHWVDSAVHAVVESVGGSVAIFAGLLLIVLGKSGRRPLYVWASSSMICMGMLSLAHALFTKSGNVFVWFESMSNIVGSVLAAGVLLPQEANEAIAASEWGYRIPILSILMTLLLAVGSLLFPQFLPVVVVGEKFTPMLRGLAILTVALFLMASARTFQRYLFVTRVEYFMIGNLFLLSGLSGMFPVSFHVWGFLWWSWHYVQLAGYLCAAALLFHTYQEMEERLERAIVETRNSNLQLEKFAYVASHDLQEPLRMVTSYLGLIEQRLRGRLDAETTHFMHYATNGAQRMKVLIDSLLSFARLESEPKHFQENSMSEIFAEVEQNLEAAIVESRAEIVATGLDEAVCCDRVQVSQVFQNLVGNALKYRSRSKPKVSVELSREGSVWHCTVRDNGIGFDPKNAERIFAPFQRLHGPDEYPGAGIGLTTCRQVIERHGGRIWAESEIGKGSAFHFTLPVHQHSEIKQRRVV